MPELEKGLCEFRLTTALEPQLMNVPLYTVCSYTSYIHNDLKIAAIGPKMDLTYEYEVTSLLLLHCGLTAILLSVHVIYSYI